MFKRRLFPGAPVFWEAFTYADRHTAPLTERGAAFEVRPPFREGSCRFFRIPFSARSIAFGRWTGLQETDHDEDGEFLSFRAISWEREVEGGVPEEAA